MHRSTARNSLGLSNLIDTPLHAGSRHDSDVGVRTSQDSGALITGATAVLRALKSCGKGPRRFDLACAGWTGEEIRVRGQSNVTTEYGDDFVLTYERIKDITHEAQPIAASAASTSRATASSDCSPLMTTQPVSVVARSKKPARTRS